jgi:uncharacterized protein (TIGR03437 family)
VKTLLACILVLGVTPAFGRITLGASNQNYKLTGLGANSLGLGEFKVTWGTCTFDGTNTTCTMSGPYSGGPAGSGIGTTGTYSFVLQYAGNGDAPIIGTSLIQDPSRYSLRGTGNFNLTGTLTPTNGSPVTFYQIFDVIYDYTGSAVCAGPAVAVCSVAQVGVKAGATITGIVSGSFEQLPVFSAPNVITASAYGAAAAAAPGSWIELYGVNLGNVFSQQWAGTDFIGNTAPVALAGTRVTVGGKSAFVFFVSPGQLNVQIPSDVSLGTQPVIVTTAGGTGSAFNLTINNTQPGVLAPPAFVIAGTQHVVALISGTLNYVLPVTVAGVTTVKAKSGDNITMYGVGFGTVTPTINAGQIAQATSQLTSALTVTIGGVPATVNYSGLNPGYVGLYQFNVVVPNVAAGDAVPVEIRQGGVKIGQTLAIAIGN